MDATLTRLDNWTRQYQGRMDDCGKHRNLNDNRHHVRQAVQMAEHTVIGKSMTGGEVPVVVNVVRTVVTIVGCVGTFRLRVVVESRGKHHWHIHQYQQPRKPHSSIVVMMHKTMPYPYCMAMGTTPGKPKAGGP